MLRAMARLRPARPTTSTRTRLNDLRRAEPDLTQLVIGLILVVIAVIGLVYTFSA
jgi:hypothetical protein